MAELIASRRGTVVVLTRDDQQGDIPGKVLIEGFEPLSAIIDSPNIEQSVNVQFQTSLSSAVYAYVFGDKMGSVTIEGTAFAARCGDSGPDLEQNGLRDVVEFYNTRRASQDKRLIVVTFGPERISGFLTAMRLYSKDPLHMLLGYSFTINALPKREPE